jgi:hypothetical protein
LPAHPSHAAQADLPWRERARNVRGAFPLLADFTGKRLLLIDDVMTTGASLDELARTVKLHGAARVALLVVARTLPPSAAPAGPERVASGAARVPAPAAAQRCSNSAMSARGAARRGGKGDDPAAAQDEFVAFEKQLGLAVDGHESTIGAEIAEYEVLASPLDRRVIARRAAIANRDLAARITAHEQAMAA